MPPGLTGIGLMKLENILKGDIREAASLMRAIEDDLPSARRMLTDLIPHTGKAHIIGITGSPGTGKSTLTDRLIGAFREEGKTVGVVAVDPSSPVSGGAILGDRIRMQRHAADPGVFIRSVATRGQLGGLSRSTYDIVAVMDAMARNVIMVESVGVGQDETDISRLVHTNVVVVIPGLGDGIQTIKAGLLETAAIFVVNKADLQGADSTVADISFLVNMSRDSNDGWEPPVLKTVALKHEGIINLKAAIASHGKYLHHHRSHVMSHPFCKHHFMQILAQGLLKKAVEQLEENHQWEAILNRLSQRRHDPYALAEEVIQTVLREKSE